MTCFGILRPKSPPLSSQNLSLYFASLINRREARRPLLIQRWKESQALSSLLFVSTFASVIRTLVFLLPLLRVHKSNFPQSQSLNCNNVFQPKKMNSLYLLIFERIEAEISLDRILF